MTEVVPYRSFFSRETIFADLKFHGLPILRRPLATHIVQFVVFFREIHENYFPRKKKTYMVYLRVIEVKHILKGMCHDIRDRKLL